MVIEKFEEKKNAIFERLNCKIKIYLSDIFKRQLIISSGSSRQIEIKFGFCNKDNLSEFEPELNITVNEFLGLQDMM